MTAKGGYSTKIIRLRSGERFPLMLSRVTGLPDAQVCSYSISQHRNGSINSAKREIDSLCLLYEWLDRQEIDLTQRIESGALFAPHEIDMLSEWMRASKRAPRTIRGTVVPRVVKLDTHSDRLGWSYDYIKWRTAPIIQRASSPAHAINLRARLTEIGEQIDALRRSGKKTQREALTEEERTFLLTVSHPDHPQNPFKPQTRYRNFAIILLLDELGTREAEPLVLKAVEDVKLHGGRPRIIITPRPNDLDDVRAKPPLVKTQGRTLIVSPVLATVLDTYAMRHRAKLKGAKRQPFFFMGTKGDGAAMTLDSVYDIFEVLRLRFPEDLPSDLNPHKMRHTWNARFRKRASELGWTEAFRDTINNYLMGWAKNSKQSAHYSHSEIIREAERMLLDLQGKIEGGA